MNISTRELGQAKIVQIDDDISHQNVKQFSDFIDDLIESGATRLVLDLGKSPWVTSRGLGAIVSAYTVLKKRGGNFVVMNPQPEVRRSLELTRLDRILDIVDDETQAEKLMGTL